ncbi:unnamed protein product [Blepharisma stoltei]|uniref:Uncharacterized protein n=1 Tax=Blepharisma stoltei TaxID=1481888 RepID=A0AAU9JTK1_9CILI|nr:unnamed protein product [Blepharisma stoltei]
MLHMCILETQEHIFSRCLRYNSLKIKLQEQLKKLGIYSKNRFVESGFYIEINIKFAWRGYGRMEETRRYAEKCSD